MLIITWEVVRLKKKQEYKAKNKLSATQEVLYQREFKRADQAGGFTEKGRR
ncbi:YfhE family protein [Siminovitchia acidinfaciens]|uniref:YfhE family protein n=1 Tax=Siminovitchia acidinfaciens TaxID=2321395 RepID=A0A429XVQ3_9BACI|nr:YfhE family protein [Siminovitchia acidinfaciens]